MKVETQSIEVRQNDNASIEADYVVMVDNEFYGSISFLEFVNSKSLNTKIYAAICKDAEGEFRDWGLFWWSSNRTELMDDVISNIPQHIRNHLEEEES